MKELSIEQKAQRYDEAIEKAKGVIEQNPLMEYLKKGIEYIFPELKESEDERIRQKLIHLVRKSYEYGGYSLHKDEADMMTAWLEKQAEHANFRNKIEVGDKVTRNRDGVLVNLSQLNRVAKKDEKQSEQKPDTNCLLSWSEIDGKMFQSLESIVKDYWAKAEQEKNEIKIREASNISYFLKTIQKSPLCWIKCSDGLPNRDGTYLVVTDGRYNDVYDIARYDSIEGWHKASEIIYWMPIPQLNNKSIVEQKPTDEEMKELLQTEYEKGRANVIAEMQKSWSEEDEKQLNNIMWIIEAYRKNGFNETHIQIADNSENWLKSLKDRVQPQQEKERKLGKLEEWLDEYISNLADVGTDTLIGSFRKYLDGKLPVKPHSQWKPTDEQMVAINTAINVLGKGTLNGKQLIELQEQLKKLKGE